MVVPKPARVSALRAELTVLNHKLPAEVCDLALNLAQDLIASRFVYHCGVSVQMKLRPPNLFPHPIIGLCEYHPANALC